jgi:hypothetical protein
LYALNLCCASKGLSQVGGSEASEALQQPSEVTLIRKTAVMSNMTDGLRRAAKKFHRPSNSDVALILTQA